MSGRMLAAAHRKAVIIPAHDSAGQLPSVKFPAEGLQLFSMWVWGNWGIPFLIFGLASCQLSAWEMHLDVPSVLHTSSPTGRLPGLRAKALRVERAREGGYLLDFHLRASLSPRGGPMPTSRLGDPAWPPLLGSALSPLTVRGDKVDQCGYGVCPHPWDPCPAPGSAGC